MQLFLNPEWFDSPIILSEGSFAYDENHNEKEGEHMYSFKHGQHRVEIQIDRDHFLSGHKSNVHDIGFAVNGDMSKREIHPKDGKVIAHKIHHVVTNHIRKYAKSGDRFVGHAYDDDENVEGRKQKVYNHFFKGLAKRGLGKIQKTDHHAGHVDSFVVKEDVATKIKAAIRHNLPGRLDRVANRTKERALKASERDIPTRVKLDITKRALLVKAAKQAENDGATIKSKNLIHQAATGKKPHPEQNYGWSPTADSIARQANMMEEAPTNSVAAGGIPSLTDGSVVPPKARNKWKRDNAKGQGILRRKVAELPIAEGTFAGMKTFIVPAHMVETTILHKRKYKHWTKYLNSDPIGRAIREYANAHPDAPIILECEKTGYMVFARYGKR